MSTLGPLSTIEAPDPVAAPAPTVAARKPLARRLGTAGAVLLLVLVAVAVLAPVLARHDPMVPSGRPYERPSASHPLGTNDVGQDLFSQLLYGSRISLLIGTLSAVVALTVGLAVALVAGYRRGRLENVLMRVVDLTLAFPFLVLVIVLAAFFGRGLWTTVLVIGAVMWARPARVLRSQVLKVAEYQHVTAARAMGASNTRCICRHVLPRIAPLAAAQFVRAANISVLLESSLAFLGLGDPNRVSWGTTLYFANARNAFLTDAWLWWIVPPGLALTMAILGFAFLGYAVEEAADPRLSRTASRRRRRPGRQAPAPAPEAVEPTGVLDVRDLVVEYRGDPPTRAVDGVSFSLGPGRVVGLVGESGSGKSTLVMALLGLLRPPGRVVAGHGTVNGRDLGRLRRSELAKVRGREVALIPQNAMNALNPAYTVHRQVAEAAALTRRDSDEAARRASEVLELVGIPASRHRSYPHELSGGMRQRVVIAMAIANQPAVLVADEPVTGLDVVTQARVLRLLLELRERMGLAILLISHDLPMVARVADDILVMYGGRIVESGTARAVTSSPHHPYTRQLLAAFPSLRGPRRRLASIVGEPPDLARPPSGCPFHPRCPDAVEACRHTETPLAGVGEVGEGHQSACILGRPE